MKKASRTRSKNAIYASLNEVDPSLPRPTDEYLMFFYGESGAPGLTIPRPDHERESRFASYFGLFGWYGVVATIAAYILVSFLILPPTSLGYQMLNLTGALGITIETLYKKDYQPFWLNLIWMLIAAVAIINLFHPF